MDGLALSAPSVLAVRTTVLDMFRKFCDSGRSGYIKERDVVLAHRGLTAINDKMRIGLKWHECMANGRNDPLFVTADLRAARDLVGDGLKEIERARQLPCGVFLVGHIDHWLGPLVIDHKTTFDDIDYFNYDASIQWRSYLWLTEAVCFKYVVWRLGRVDDPVDEQYYVRDKEVVTFYRYSGMQYCLDYWASRFRDWWFSRGFRIKED